MTRWGRNFSSTVKRSERGRVNYKCSILSCKYKYDKVECCHILSASQQNNLRRRGSLSSRWSNHKFVRSSKNCIVLCPQHHKLIDSPKGLHKYTVTYLTKLKRLSLVLRSFNNILVISR